MRHDKDKRIEIADALSVRWFELVLPLDVIRIRGRIVNLRGKPEALQLAYDVGRAAMTGRNFCANPSATGRPT